MKYKLSDKLNAFLTDNVLPEHKGWIENDILDSFGKSDILITKMFQVEASKTMYGVEFCITVMRSDLIEVEPLKPYVWYESEKFDGNPEDYPLVESTGETYCCTYKLGSKTLYSTTKHFMYIEKLNK